MSFINNEKGISELVGALMVLLILVVYLGVMQTRQVPEWNTDIEKQHFDTVHNDFANLRSDLEDISTKNIPKKSTIHMGTKYPSRFMLQNPGPGASGMLSTYPLRINISYDTNTGIKWRNYTSMGIKYKQNGISNSPVLVYENGIMIEDYGNGKYFTIDENQSLVEKDNIFIPVLNGNINSGSSMDIESLNIQPLSKEGFSQAKFFSMNATIETQYPQIWKKPPNESMPDGSDYKIENGTNCTYSNSSCINIINIAGYNIRKINLPANSTIQSLENQLYMGMISFDNSMLNSRGKTGPDGQDMWEKNQGRLDIPSSDKITQFILQDITMARVQDRRHHNNDDNEDEREGSNPKMKFSITDTQGHLWTVEIKFKTNLSSLETMYVKQQYPPISTADAPYGKYDDFSPPYGSLFNITDTRTIDLTYYYNTYSNISSPNILTIDKMDSEILYVNFLIN